MKILLLSKSHKLHLLCLVILLTAVSSFAATIVGESSDHEVDSDNKMGSDSTEISIRVGGSNGDSHDASGGRNGLFVFRHPNLNASAGGATFTSATLSFNHTGRSSNPAFKGDLYRFNTLQSSASLVGGTRNRTPGSATTAYFSGTADPSSGVTSIQNDFVTSSTGSGTVWTSSSGSSNLLAFLKTAYGNGAGLGKYVVLRISPDSAIAATPGAIGYNFTSANGTVQPAIICLTSADSSAPEDLVNPMIGAAGTGKGSCMPGPCLPFSSIYPSPETLSPAPSGYTAGKSIVGFAQLHTQGTGGTPSYGNFLITPSLTLRLTDANRASATSNEVAKAYAYNVRLTKDNILAEVTPSAHSAIYRFNFPNASNAYVSIDVARKVAGNLALKNGSVQVDPSTGTITGGGTYDRNWNPASYKVYFAARLLSTFPATGGTWVGSTAQDGVLQASTSTRQSLGAYLSFATVANQPVYLKVAVSFTSASKATEWLNAEIPAWDYEATSAAAALTWRRQLSAISVPGAAADNTTRIYTALWHSMVQPRNRTGDVPAYPAMAPLWDDHYTLWDTWKNLFPLMSILRPDMVRDNVNAFITRFQKNLPTGNGYVTEGFIQNKEFKVGQGGNEVDNVIAEAYVKGITGVKWNDAYTLIKYDADSVRTHGYRTRGWVGSDETGTGYTKRMRSGSGTLSFAYDDYCVSQVARGLGKTADAQTYLQRAGNWANVWDPTLTSEGYSGFAHSRKNDGTFSTTAATAGYNTDFYEGTCWEYSFFVPHDLPGLVSRMGGKPLFIQRLVHAFKQGYIQFNNEPSFMMIWLFDQVNRPYLASYWANEFLSRYDGMDLPGDDDSGAMSSLYIFLTSGLFPTSGQDIYYLHGAHVPKMIFHLPNGKTFTVTAQHVSSTNIFVQSATLNGQPLNVPLIHHSDIVAGGTLNFVMGSQASAWGTNGEFNAATAAAELAP